MMHISSNKRVYAAKAVILLICFLYPIFLCYDLGKY